MYSTSKAQCPTSSPDDFYLYTADALENIDEIQLTRGGLILIVLLSGGDYHDGMPGCGIAISHGLARCGFGNRLLDVFGSMARDAFFRYLCSSWAFEVSAELRSNSQGFLRTRQPKLAEQLPRFLSALDHKIVERYMSPLTTWTGPGMFTSSQSNHPWPGQILRQAPDVMRIAEFCFMQLGWTEITKLIQTLRNNLWEGVIYQMLLSVSYFSKETSNPHMTFNTFSFQAERLVFHTHISLAGS